MLRAANMYSGGEDASGAASCERKRMTPTIDFRVPTVQLQNQKPRKFRNWKPRATIRLKAISTPTHTHTHKFLEMESNELRFRRVLPALETRHLSVRG